MPSSVGAAPWILRPRPVAGAKYRLYCFPFAGVGPSVYRPWLESLPPEIEARFVQLPGREGRWREAPMTQMAEIAPAVTDALRSELDMPFIFYGHSLGALTAFEVTRRLRASGGPLPVHLFVGAHRAPHLPNPHPEMRHLADDAFVEELRQRYDGIPQAVLDNPELLELMLPCLRADFQAYETYRYTDDEPLPCPISAFGGEVDRYVRPPEIAGWRDQTTGRFRMRLLTANHFFVQSEKARVLSAIQEDLVQAATGAPMFAG